MSGVLYEVKEGIAIITLNRPEAMNAFNADMGKLWTDYYLQADADDSVKVIIVTANGPAWCAGADMSGGGDTFDSKEGNFSSCPVYPAFKLRKPVIAALTGHAIGVGFSLAVQADFRIVADEAKYGLMQIRRGVFADGVMHWLLPRMIGVEKALKVTLMAQRFLGKEMVELGLALKSVPADQVFDEAMEMAKEIALYSAPVPMALAKKLIWDGLDMSVDELEKEETRLMHFTMGKADAIEGGMAFIERRDPNWTDKISEQWPEAYPKK